MLLFRPQNFLVSLLTLIAVNTHLSAFDIPMELPSGQIIHFETEEFLSIDLDSYTVSLRAPIQDLEEFRFFSENPGILKLLAQSVQRKWKLHDVEFLLEEFLPYIPLPKIDIFPIERESIFKFESFPPPPSQYVPPKAEQMISYGAGIVGLFTSPTSILIPDHVISTDSGAEVENTSLKDERIDFIPEKTQNNKKSDHVISTDSGAELENTSLKDERIDFIPEVTQDNKKAENTHTSLISENVQEESKRYLRLSFSIAGNDFGGGWRLSPYELRFIRRQDNDLDEMVLLISSDRSVLYKREQDNPIFTPSKNTSMSLRDNLDGTYILVVPSQGEFLFNSEGQLIHFIGLDKANVIYNYSGNQLVNIIYPNAKTVSFEYSEGRVVSINGSYNTVYLEYNEKNVLCKIFDNQGFSLSFSYEDNEFEEVTDETGAIVESKPFPSDVSQLTAEIPLIFNGYGEVFYCKNAQNTWKLFYRQLDSEEND